MKRIHCILIAFFNPEQTATRWNRDVKPALAQTGLDYCVSCVDNSPQASPLLHDLFGNDYLWQDGKNLLYGPSINLAVPRHPSDYILYVCTKHGQALNHNWVNELLQPLQNEPEVAMTGHLMGSNSPGGVAHDCNAPWIKEFFYFTEPDGTGVVPQHVQGGVFMARTELMLRFPYPPDVQHLYTDHIITWNVLKAGYKIRNIPSVRSVWRDVIKDLTNVSYAHDEVHT